MLPKLISLSINRMPLFPATIEWLMESSQLQHLRLDKVMVYGHGWDLSELDPVAPLTFDYPCHWSDTSQVSKPTADEQQAKRRNRRLRLKVWRRWDQAVQKCVRYFGHEVHLDDMSERCGTAQKQLQAEVDEAAGDNEEDSSDHRESEPDEPDEWSDDEGM